MSERGGIGCLELFQFPGGHGKILLSFCGGGPKRAAEDDIVQSGRNDRDGEQQEEMGEIGYRRERRCHQCGTSHSETQNEEKRDEEAGG